ncbi:hypothetical protein NKR19_g6820 [Coniochaeta hoffmannii]|uniref:WW domain-containing protein n=1 Tax=Coniochaeta hoffmannii TaxID=91930 RepID=A0AA38RCU0_9PEZI|nr:hypothetical protein NKR19_g6820 [Coniochaeta hoffmannii]
MATADQPKVEAAAAVTKDPTDAEAAAESPKPETTDSEQKQQSGSPARSESPASSVTSPTSTERDEAERQEAEEAGPSNEAILSTENQGQIPSSAAPLPNEPLPAQTSSAPPLPSEPVPGQPTPLQPALPAEPTAVAAAQQPEDDGWEYHWNASTSSYWFYNRFTQVWQETNPRLQPGYGSAPPLTIASTAAGPAPIAIAPGQVISDPTSVAGGYNPAIHGDYDPNAWYAQAAARAAEEPPVADPLVLPGGGVAAAAGEVLAGDNAAAMTVGFFNRHTGAWQNPDQGPERHGDEAKSRRQLNNFFDVDAAANEHDGRSLKAERRGYQPSKAELKAFKEKRRARKEEKRRAWLRD